MRIKHELLRKLRLERGWRQIDAADAVKIDERTYRRYESGQVNRGQNATNYTKQYEILRDLAAVHHLDGPESLIEDEGVIVGGKSGPVEAVQRLAPQPPDAPYDYAWYVHREVDERRAINRLRSAGAPVVLHGPQLYGKATMLGYLIEQHTSRTPGCRSIRLNLAAADRRPIASLDELLRTIAQGLVDAIPGSELLAEAAMKRPGTESSKLGWLLEKLLAQHDILLAIEKADAVHGLPDQAEFFAMLRGWSERGTRLPWSRLRLIVTVSTEPSLLESIDHSSFFVLANPLLLDDFAASQVLEMAHMYDLHPTDSEVASLLELLGGNPYLLRLAFYECVVGESSLARILSETNGGIFLPYLLRLRGWLEAHGLLPIIRQVVTQNACEIPFEQYCRLYAKGLLCESSTGVYRLRARLYEYYFGPLGRRG